MLSHQATVFARSQVELPQRLIKFKNCRILRNHKIIREDLWVRNGKIINPEKIFFDEKRQAHVVSQIIMKCKRVYKLSSFYKRLKLVLSIKYFDSSARMLVTSIKILQL